MKKLFFGLMLMFIMGYTHASVAVNAAVFSGNAAAAAASSARDRAYVEGCKAYMPTANVQTQDAQTLRYIAGCIQRLNPDTDRPVPWWARLWVAFVLVCIVAGGWFGFIEDHLLGLCMGVLMGLVLGIVLPGAVVGIITGFLFVLGIL